MFKFRPREDRIFLASRPIRATRWIGAGQIINDIYSIFGHRHYIMTREIQVFDKENPELNKKELMKFIRRIQVGTLDPIILDYLDLKPKKDKILVDILRDKGLEITFKKAKKTKITKGE